MLRDLLTALPYLVALVACAVALVIAIHYAELRGPSEDAPRPELQERPFVHGLTPSRFIPPPVPKPPKTKRAQVFPPEFQEEGHHG